MTTQSVDVREGEIQRERRRDSALPRLNLRDQHGIPSQYAAKPKETTAVHGESTAEQAELVYVFDRILQCLVRQGHFSAMFDRALCSAQRPWPARILPAQGPAKG